MRAFPIRVPAAVLACVALPLSAATFNVVTDGSASDTNLADNACNVSGGGCNAGECCVWIRWCCQSHGGLS